MNNRIPFAALSAALVLLPTIATATITFSAGYTGPWKWDELTMTVRTEGLSTYYKGTAEITGYTGSATEITIPNKISWHHNVTADGDVVTHFEYEVEVVSINMATWSYRFKENVTSIVFPNCITNIANCVFTCPNLTSITIPNSVKSIGPGAFSSPGLISIIIPGSVTSIGDNAFSGCSGLPSISIPNSVTTIGAAAFYGCSGLTAISIPNSVTSIGDRAFSGCSGLSAVTISGNITNVWSNSYGPFSQCSSLRTVVLGNGMTKIGSYMFYNLPSLESITIPATVTNIESHAFSSCSGLKNVYLSDIAAWCAIPNLDSSKSPFRYALNLYLNGQLVTALVIPDGVASIPSYAFYNCDCLQSVHIPDSVKTIGSSAFSGCDSLTAVRVPQSAMTQRLESIFGSSYQKLRGVTLGSDVSTIRDDEFLNFRALETLTIEDGNASFRVAADGCLYDRDQTMLVACPRNATEITIPATVTKIYDYALDGCGALWANWYKALSNLAANGAGSQSGGGEAPDPRYALADGVADRSIATVTVDGDCAIDAFVLADGKVFDTVLRVINVADSAATLSLPSGYSYERLRGTAPLTIPASSTNLLTITRTTDRTFFVAREKLEPAQ